jgi:hypothetical protein
MSTVRDARNAAGARTHRRHSMPFGAELRDGQGRFRTTPGLSSRLGWSGSSEH